MLARLLNYYSTAAEYWPPVARFQTSHRSKRYGIRIIAQFVVCILRIVTRKTHTTHTCCTCSNNFSPAYWEWCVFQDHDLCQPGPMQRHSCRHWACEQRRRSGYKNNTVWMWHSQVQCGQSSSRHANTRQSVYWIEYLIISLKLLR